jgi:hypothetical protein
MLGSEIPRSSGSLSAMPPRRPLAQGLARRWIPIAVLPLTLGVAGGCSLANDAVSGVTAPVGALPASDVVVETNLKNALASFEASAQFGVGATGRGSGPVNGPSTGPEVTSFASVGSGGAVLVAWNDADHHCLGILESPTTLAAPVIGETAAGTYYFVQTATPSSGCAASLFAATPVKPASWPAGDPSSATWPS